MERLVTAEVVNLQSPVNERFIVGFKVSVFSNLWKMISTFKLMQRKMKSKLTVVSGVSFSCGLFSGRCARCPGCLSSASRNSDKFNLNRRNSARRTVSMWSFWSVHGAWLDPNDIFPKCPAVPPGGRLGGKDGTSDESSDTASESFPGFAICFSYSWIKVIWSRMITDASTECSAFKIYRPHATVSE